MGWLPQPEFDRLRDLVMDMPQDQRDTLTWEEAGMYIPADTLCMAQWSGMVERKDYEPYKALCMLHGINTR